MANRLDARAVAMDIFRNTVRQAALLKDSRVMVSKSLPLLETHSPNNVGAAGTGDLADASKMRKWTQGVISSIKKTEETKQSKL